MADDSAGLLARLETERARVLRRRVVIFCGVGLALLVVSAVGHVMDWARATPESGPFLRAALPYVVLYDALLWLLFGGTLVSLLLRLPTRRGIVGQVQRLTAGACVVALVLEGVTAQMDPGVVSGEVAPSRAAFEAARFAIGAVALVFWLAMSLIPMRWRESGAIAAVVLAGAAVALPLCIKASVGQTLASAGVLVVVLALGMAWSQWRFSAFDERFRATEVAGQLRELSGELAYARRVHEALFPPPFQRGSIRVRYRYEPMREIGGDFLYVHPASFAGLGLVPISIVLIDVTGHGISAALTVNRLHGELQRFYGLHPTASPGELITALNTFAYHAMAPHGMYATALCAQVDTVERAVRFASAGHPPAYLRTPEGTVHAMEATGVMLGVLEPAAFDSGEAALPTPMGGSVLAYTDGAFEAFDAKGEQFSLERVREFGAAPSGDRARALVEAVLKFRSGRAQDDLLAVEVAWGGGETIMQPPPARSSAAKAATRLTKMITRG